MDTHRIITVGDEYEVGFAEGKKVGIELVVGWVEKNRNIISLHGDKIEYTDLNITLSVWRAKLKEWGITP